MLNNKIKIAPSILSADFAKLGEEIEKITEAGADYIHIDVMDGSFVPNITIGPDVIKHLKKHTHLPFDVHLMIENVDFFIPKFADAGADIITIHMEASTHADRSLNLIKSLGKKAGISIVPSTHESSLEYVLPLVDLVLIMTVNPGFGGQSFINSQLNKIKNVKEMITNLGKNIELEVDGGINDKTANLVIENGADVLVSGNYIFTHPNGYKEGIKSLK
ncbi:MAG: ribulose-phosphate 3-epimerase [Sphingobacteriia bacterium]|nr:ribulose-phosphate 3-epimerase [Sphingobacteriia bacterium]